MSSEENLNSSASIGTAPAVQEEIPGPLPTPEVAAEIRADHPISPPNPGAESGLPEETPIPSLAIESVPELQIELPNVEPELADSAEIDTLLADMEKFVSVPKGKVVRGKVQKVTDTEVKLNVGFDLEGSIPIIEFASSDGQVTVTPGDEVDVWVEAYNEKQGTVTLSRQKAIRLEVWERIEGAFRDQKTIRGRVLDRIKGGVTVDVGVRAFMPSSQTDVRPLRNVDSLLGQEIECKIIKLIRKRGNVVVSRKLALEEELNQRRAELLEHLEEGIELIGRVKNLTDYGAFVDLGGMDGLLHVTDMSWARLARPSDAVEVGQEVTVKVLKFDAEKGRISLGLKQLLPDPWEQVQSTYSVGARVKGRVVSVTDYGAFVEIEPGVEGLVHVSELSWSKRPKHPSKIVKVGDQMEVAVLEVHAEQRRISLSLKQTLPDPWSSLAEKFPVGTQVEAAVTNLTDFGAFAEIDSEIEGLIHNTDLSWTKKVKHPSEILKKGQRIKAVVLNLDPAQRRLSLGVKQLQADPWETFLAGVQVGDKVKGKVARMAAFGTFVEIQEGIEGLCHTSEFMSQPGSGAKTKPEIGSELEFRVIRLDPADRKISLSLRPATAATPSGRGERKANHAVNPSGTSSASGESRKRPEPTTAMAEALSAAGITSTPKAQPEPASVKPVQVAASAGDEPRP